MTEPIVEIQKRIDNLIEERGKYITNILNDIPTGSTYWAYHTKISKDFINFLKKHKIKKKFLKIIKKLRRESYHNDWYFRGWSQYKTYLQSYKKEQWDIIKKCLDIINEYKNKYEIFKGKKELCRLTECYQKLSNKKKRTDIALKICGSCGFENIIEAKFCSMCGEGF